MAEDQKILLVYKFNHPDVDSLQAALAAQFPAHPIELLNIKQMVKRHPGIFLLNIFHMFKEYPLRQLLGYWKIWRRFWATPYMHRQVRRLVGAHAARGNYGFTFQTHSDFDASTPELPNFIYTDTTNLANLYTPNYSTDKLFSENWRALETETYQHAAMTFTRSSHIRRSLLEQYHIPPEKSAVVYAGSNIPLRETDLEEKDYTTKEILFVGVAWERKGGPDLVEAFRAVLEKHPDAHLTIVGCTPKLDLPNVQTVDKLPLAEMPPYYQRASIFCLPTRLEPFGIVFVEAMAYGLPLVAPNTGAVPDFLEDGRNGYMVAPRDVPALTRALLALLDDPQRCRAFGKVGSQLAHERYTWNKVGQRMKAHILPFLTQEVPHGT
ncbi:MAG: glycogen synthase [Chloroflexota bacterium]|nr:glycogen synthase [Chloroflexota bacterium]